MTLANQEIRNNPTEIRNQEAVGSVGVDACREARATARPAATGPAGAGGSFLDTNVHNSPLVFEPEYLDYLNRLISRNSEVNDLKREKRCKFSVIAGLNAAVAKNDVIRLVTLTSSPESPADINRSWQIARQRLKRRGFKIEYIKVAEFNASGNLRHLHLLTYGSYIPHRTLQRIWKEVHKAFHVNIKKVGTKQAAWYVSKYVTKSLQARREMALDIISKPDLTPEDTERVIKLLNERSYTYSQGWAFKGFRGFWRDLVGRWWRMNNYHRGKDGFWKPPTVGSDFCSAKEWLYPLWNQLIIGNHILLDDHAFFVKDARLHNYLLEVSA